MREGLKRRLRPHAVAAKAYATKAQGAIFGGIMLEAADRIEALEAQLAEAERRGMERAAQIADECDSLRTKCAIMAEIKKGTGDE